MTRRRKTGKTARTRSTLFEAKALSFCRLRLHDSRHHFLPLDSVDNGNSKPSEQLGGPALPLTLSLIWEASYRGGIGSLIAETLLLRSTHTYTFPSTNHSKLPVCLAPSKSSDASAFPM
jgi:hypothetical protein